MTGTPAISATSASVVPISTSMTPERGAPLMVSSAVPRVSPRPASRNHRSPKRAISAAWARVSTFWTSVGRPSTPRSNGRGGFDVGRASPSLTKWTAADSSPAMYDRGGATSSIGIRVRSARDSSRRSANARSRAAIAWVCSEPTYRMIHSAPTASAASSAPSSTRCGRVAIRTRSFADRGSPSAPLARTIASPYRLLRDRGPLAGDGEAGSAAAQEARRLEQGRGCRARELAVG